MDNKVDISEITSNLKLENGIYYSNNIKSVSFPDKGNDGCYLIEDRSYWFQQRNEVLKTVINKYALGKTIFDIGGGNGFVSACLVDEGYETFLIEPGIDGILNAKKRGIKYLVNAAFEDVEFKINSIDNAGLFDIIEHIENDIDFLKKLYPLIKNNGKLFISVPAFNLLWSNADISAGHYRRHTVKSLTKLMNEAGFRVVYDTYFFSFLVLFIFLFRTIPTFIFGYKPNQRIIKNEHRPSSSISISFLNMLHKWELSRIKRNKKIFLGSSCLIVAAKK